jgi:hypothetical protein
VKMVHLAVCFYWFLAWLAFRRPHVSTKRRALSELHGVTAQKTVLFVIMAVRTSNPTCG